MFWRALRDIDGSPQGCLGRDNAATLTGGRRTYLIGLSTGLVRPSRATLLRRVALRAARESRSAGNEQADTQKRQGQHSMEIYDHWMANARPAGSLPDGVSAIFRSVSCGRVCTVSMRPGKSVENCPNTKDIVAGMAGRAQLDVTGSAPNGFRKLCRHSGPAVRHRLGNTLDLFSRPRGHKWPRSGSPTRREDTCRLRVTYSGAPKLKKEPHSVTGDQTHSRSAARRLGGHGV